MRPRRQQSESQKRKTTTTTLTTPQSTTVTITAAAAITTPTNALTQGAVDPDAPFFGILAFFCIWLPRRLYWVEVAG